MEKLHASVIVDAGAKSTRYSRRIFGGFLEHFGTQIYGGVYDPGSPLSDQRGFRKDAMLALRELNVPIVRWPGGCYVSGYHWADGVGKTRTATDDMAWGVVESHAFGTDEFVELCRALNWEPYICNNAGDGTIEEMCAWVQYCNGRQGPFAQMRKDGGNDESHDVKIWSIGNENWGKHEIGYKPIEQWAPLVLEAARAMKEQCPDIQLSAAALPSREWALPLIEMAGEYLDFISIHSYWLPLHQKNDMPDYLTCIMNSDGPEETISQFVRVLDDSGYRGKMKIAYDEWNLRGWYHPGFPRKCVQDYHDPEVQRLVDARKDNLIASQYTMADALFTASFYNACLRHADDIGMANIAPLVNTRGPLHVHPAGIVKRTHFHAMAMYANLLKKDAVESRVSSDQLIAHGKSIPVMDAIVTCDSDRRNWAIALINRHDEQDVVCGVSIHGHSLEGQLQATILSGDTVDSYNSIADPNRVTPNKTRRACTDGSVILPPHSLTIIDYSVA